VYREAVFTVTFRLTSGHSKRCDVLGVLPVAS
jgi:hypothetical protein